MNQYKLQQYKYTLLRTTYYESIYTSAIQTTAIQTTFYESIYTSEHYSININYRTNARAHVTSMEATATDYDENNIPIAFDVNCDSQGEG
jgi:hypothetical protein